MTIASSYASEVSPVEVRGVATSAVQFLIGIGQLFAVLMIKAFGTLGSLNAYRIPFAIQFAFPAIILIGLPFCPESPWYLIRNSKFNEALKSLLRLGYPSPEAALADLSETITKETKTSANATYIDCFRGSDLRRTEIAMGVFCVSQLTGVVFALGYSSYFFELAGLGASQSFSLTVGVLLLGLVGIICSWFLINTAGRRPTLLYGTLAVTFVLLLIGIMDVIPTNSRAPVYIQVACVVLFTYLYFLSVGPMAWTIFAEISSSRLRSRTVGLGIVVQNLFGILLNIVVPLMINPDAGNLGGKIGFVFAATAGLSAIWVHFRVPETAHRSVDDLDAMFSNKVPARKFKEYISQ